MNAASDNQDHVDAAWKEPSRPAGQPPRLGPRPGSVLMALLGFEYQQQQSMFQVAWCGGAFSRQCEIVWVPVGLCM